MKILLFTHKIDIDGMGSAVLANLAFDDAEIVLCDTFEIDAKLETFLQDKSIKNYDKVFITDLCPSYEMLETINKTHEVKNKLLVFDHHVTDFKKNDFEFVSIIVENENGKCCGTSLFLEYLKKSINFATTPAIETFVELTRRYDTWEWKTRFFDDAPNDLNILFGVLGADKYIANFTNKLKIEREFFYTKSEKSLIKNKKNEIKKICKQLLSRLDIVFVDNLKAGVVKDTDGAYRNEFAEYLKDIKFDIDCMIMLNFSRNTASIRSIKPNIDVSSLAKKYNGKGHTASGGCPLSQELLKALGEKYIQ